MKTAGILYFISSGIWLGVAIMQLIVGNYLLMSMNLVCYLATLTVGILCIKSLD
jgi:hypothetical protein